MGGRIPPVLAAVGVLGSALGLVACVPPGTPPPGPGGGPIGCSMFPGDNIWNTRVDTLPVSPSSDAYVNAVGASSAMHADFGSGEWNGGPIGIPYAVVKAGQPLVNVSFGVQTESNPGPYPIPADVPIEGGAASGGDRHVLVVDVDACRLYEMYSAYPNGDGSWRAYSGAVFDLRSNGLRPDTWTSADAAGLPILAGLVRYDEVVSGQIRHALRITAPITRSAHVWPARHDASSYTDPAVPPMGQRFRLKASFDLSGFPPALQVILQAMKTYGVILADNGAPWFVSGAPDARWDNDVLHQLRNVPGSAFEAVDASALQLAPDSGQARQP